METRPGPVVFRQIFAPHTHHRDAKEGRISSGYASRLIDQPLPLSPFDKDLANGVASINIGADSAAPCPSDREINQNKFIHIYTQNQFL